MDHPPTLDLFVGELRRARTAAGLSQDALGQAIQYSGSLVAMVEQCRRLPKPDFTLRCDETLKTGGLLERIRDVMVRESLMPWFREWVTIEQEASALRSYEPLVVPGLLQTEEYARALHEGASQLTTGEIEQQVTARLERQAVLNRDRPPHLVAILDEYVLRRPVGGSKVMRGQLLHLAEVGGKPRIHLHIVPATVGAYAGLNGAFVIATPLDGDDVAYLDNQLQGQIVERAAEVRPLRITWESVRAEALSHRQSMEMITEAAQRWT